MAGKRGARSAPLCCWGRFLHFFLFYSLTVVSCKGSSGGQRSMNSRVCQNKWKMTGKWISRGPRQVHLRSFFEVIAVRPRYNQKVFRILCKENESFPTDFQLDFIRNVETQLIFAYLPRQWICFRLEAPKALQTKCKINIVKLSASAHKKHCKHTVKPLESNCRKL